MKSKSFGLFCLKYAMLVLCIGALLLLLLTRFLSDYEHTRVETAVAEYTDSFNSEYLRPRAGEFLKNIDSNIQDADEAYGYIEDLISEGISCRKNVKLTSDYAFVYDILAKGQIIGQINLIQDEVLSLGMQTWKVESDEFDFSFLLADGKSVTIPSDYSVYADEYLLDSEYIAEEAIAYEELEVYSEYSSELPFKVTYSIGNYIGDIPLLIYDRNGEYVSTDSTDGCETGFLDNCSESEKEELNEFIAAFINAYNNFSSSHIRNAEGYYWQLDKYMLTGSDVQVRTYASIDGLLWSLNRAMELKSVTVNSFVSLGSGYYMCDVTYIVDVQGREGYVLTTNNYYVTVVRTDDNELKAVMMSSY